MDTTSIRVVMETAAHRFEGDLTLPKEGYRSRLSDYLNQGDLSFVALSDAVVTDLEDGRSYERDFVVVGTRHVLLAHHH